eukprot:1583426-Prymnesium_polylepis.2
MGRRRLRHRPPGGDVGAEPIAGVRNHIKRLRAKQHAGQKLAEDRGQLHEAKCSPSARPLKARTAAHPMPQTTKRYRVTHRMIE